jgi:hypothetical protein
MGDATHIPTRYALVKRMQKILKDIDDYYQDCDDFGLTLKEADPDGVMGKIRAGLIDSLDREKRLGLTLATDAKNA